MNETVEAKPVTAAMRTVSTTTTYGALAPVKGDRVERVRNGVNLRGRVFYADALQMLVKWDDGSSGSLRLDLADERSGVRVVDDH